jgi:hypothetical protein
LARDVILTPEILQVGNFPSYRQASSWLRDQKIAALFELKEGGWKLYLRVVVERALEKRAKSLPFGSPSEIKRSLLDLVASGTSVHQASIAHGIPYATAKRWASSERRT